MKFSSFALASLSFFEATSSVTSFSPAKAHTSIIVTRRMGYLDDLAADLSAPDSNPIPAEEAREANVMSKDKIVGAGPGDWDSYVEFDEFDGGDGQMGVAGDGNKGLDKFDMSTIAKSKSMSGKNKIIESNQIKSYVSSCCHKAVYGTCISQYILSSHNSNFKNYQISICVFFLLFSL